MTCIAPSSLIFQAPPMSKAPEPLLLWLARQLPPSSGLGCEDACAGLLGTRYPCGEGSPSPGLCPPFFSRCGCNQAPPPLCSRGGGLHRDGSNLPRTAQQGEKPGDWISRHLNSQILSPLPMYPGPSH